jgi:hypothetical protein
VDGWDEPGVSRGGVVCTVRKYSAALLIFLLKAKRPDVYREHHDLTSNNRAPLLPPATTLSTPELIVETKTALAVLEAHTKPPY